MAWVCDLGGVVWVVWRGWWPRLLAWGVSLQGVTWGVRLGSVTSGV